MIGLVVCFMSAIICLTISILQFREKGFCLNNAYIYASREEQEKMNKRPYYRQSAIVFFLLFLTFTVLGIYVITAVEWFLILEMVMIAAAIIYAIASTIYINKK